MTLVLGVVAGLVVFQPHMSGTILILVGGAAVLFAAGHPLGLVSGGGRLVAGLAAIIIVFTPYMNARIDLWLDPWNDPQGNGYQTIQSLIAIGSGGLLGLGLGNSSQKLLYMPEPENDFVFSIVVEELGFVGGCVVLILFALLILRGYWLALHARDKFGTLTIVGIITLLAAQVLSEHRRGHQPDPQHGHLPALLQLRRHRPDDTTGGDGHHPEHLPADPGAESYEGVTGARQCT